MPSIFFIRRRLRDLSIPRKLSLIIGLFSVVVIVLLSVSYIGMQLLSGVRAYVGGEGLWSKSQKQAVYRLTRYTETHDPQDYEKYLEHIAIPMGDRKARLEIAKPRLDYSRVVEGFVQGRNHADDVQPMIWLARYLHNFPYMKKALTIWGEADDSMLELQRQGEALHQEMVLPHPSPQRLNTLTRKIVLIDERLTPLEDNFSYTLGAGARWIKALVLGLMLLTTLLFLALTLFIALHISRHMSQEIQSLRDQAARIASGDYSFTLDIDSQDEIGDLARSFQLMASQRQQAEKMKDEFFANVWHELRTPLTLILSPLESLLAGDQGPVNVRVGALLKTMHNNTVRLLQLVNGLLDFAKLSAGKLQVEREPIRIAELTEMLFNDFRPLMQQKNITGQCGVEPPEAVVLMDRHFYERIVFNLLSNAVKFTEAGGRVDLRVVCSGDRLTLTVSDTGIGIPENEMNNIFQRFRQVEGSSTRRFEGTGLGLALVKELTGLLEGSITVDSTPGQGSRFTLTCSAPAQKSGSELTDLARGSRLLKAQQYDSESPMPGSASASLEPMPRVLVAEDNAAMAAYVTALLYPFCEVRTACDGEDALQKMRAWMPDLVLTDVMMPKRDGLSLCREMKATPALSHIPVVMLTALTHREALLEGWKAGANEYLFKPFHPKELVTRVQSMLKATQDQHKAQEKITQLNENLRRQTMDLALSNKEWAAFSYSVSHDLRTPLRAIEGFTQALIDSESTFDPNAKTDLRRIAAATQQMEQLIDDLLKLSQVSRSELSVEAMDLSACVQGILHKLREAEPTRTIETVVKPNVTVHADAHLLTIVLDNLMQNAWKFTRRNPRARIEFGMTEEAGRKTFYVRDNGAGFDMAYIDQLFKPFKRLHKPSDFPGTGLGLALADRIIRRHGGRIWAEGKEPLGAVFYFTLT